MMILAMIMMFKCLFSAIDFATRYSTRYSDFLSQPYSNPTRSKKNLLAGAWSPLENHFEWTSIFYNSSTITRQIWEKLKIWRQPWMAKIMGSPHWTSISEDGSTGGLNWQLAVYTMHRIVPFNFWCVFSNMFCLLLLCNINWLGWLGGRAGKKGC